MGRGVALAGFMGVGKSTVGAALAPRLGLGFMDLDAEIAAESGRSVPQIFSCEGEAGFRAREAATLRRILRGPPVVLALGGGTLHQPGNLDALQACCTVVSLLADLDEIRGRLGAEDEQRPLWADAEARFAAREAGYHRADFCVDVSGLDISDSVDAVLGVLPCG
jgi:shikimate kinase